MTTRRAQSVNLLECCPERAAQAEMEGDRVVVLRPRFLRGLLARWLQPLLRRPHFRVHLDAIGSFVWLRCDGRTRVAEIALALEEQFGETAAPAVDRLALFLRHLEHGQMIRMHLPNGRAAAPTGVDTNASATP
jgi:hypothetical protein